METVGTSIGTSYFPSNFNYVGFSPYSTTSNCSYHVNDEHYDIKPFDQYPYSVGSNGIVSYTFLLFIILANIR